MPDGGEDEVTLGEVSRNLAAMRRDFGERFTELATTMGQHVTIQLYQVEIAAIRDRLTASESKVQRIEDERDRMRLAMFTAIVAPIVVALIVGGLVLRGLH